MSEQESHHDIHEAAALRIVSLYRSGAHARLDDYRALWQLSRWPGIDIERVSRALVAAFDLRRMDRVQLLRIPVSMLPEHTYTRRGEWISELSSRYRGLPHDFLDVVEEVGDWLYAIRLTIADAAEREELEDRLHVETTPSPSQRDNVISMAAYRVARR